jgi:hypothetical protein
MADRHSTGVPRQIQGEGERESGEHHCANVRALAHPIHRGILARLSTGEATFAPGGAPLP